MSKRHSASIAFSMLVLAALCGCQPTELIHNALIDRWCGDRPCDWDVKGKIERVGTWHDKDYAVRFVSDHAQISQLNSTADADNADCYAFTMLAKVEHGTRLFLELDFQDDRKIDFSQRIPESDWDHRQFLITPPTWYQGVRFILRKDGPDYAALAQLSAQTSHDCTAQPIDLRGRPAGAQCEEDAQCAKGVCTSSGTCSVCTQDTDCGDGGLCAPTQRGNDPMLSCTPPAGLGFASACDRDEECETGFCCNGACSTCCSDVDCPQQRSCGFSAIETANDTHPPPERIGWPKQCGAGMHLGKNNDPCTNDADCASDDCETSEISCSEWCSDGGLGCWSCFGAIGGWCH